jgi:hypothetical protein
VFDRILFAKIGWAPNYEGEDCTGDFGEPNETDSWYERFNFLPGPNGRYYSTVHSVSCRYLSLSGNHFCNVSTISSNLTGFAM